VISKNANMTILFIVLSAGNGMTESSRGFASDTSNGGFRFDARRRGRCEVQATTKYKLQ
jgi:hypothetical protein